MKKFKAPLRHLEGNLGWRIVDVPFDVAKAFGRAGTVPVRGTVNGFAFKTSLFPRKDKSHFLLVNKAMQRGAGATEIGDTIAVELELDTKKRTVRMPSELAKELEDAPELVEYYNTFSYSMRKYFSDTIAQPKSEAVRQKRAREMAEVLVEMMEGESSPPPVLVSEFARNPLARKGWELSTPAMKRGHLWGIHYYKPGPARERRIQKAIDAMVAQARKKR